ncbi:hypothetical protein [Salinilacihabitans rarus]|uniref:hypothetical protein n=1 Tax=Salinilacihabitans rarus TaxID=2961596 RepID=UPI0020C8BA8F|nr:hypothetical protein [Salinilacihabitans rarus]
MIEPTHEPGAGGGGTLQPSRDRLRRYRTLALVAAAAVAALHAAVGAIGQSQFAESLPGIATAVDWRVGTPVALGAVALLVARTVDDDTATVGLVGLGTFALLGAVVGDALLPALCAVLLGGAVATARSLPRGRPLETGIAWGVAIALLSATAASLAGALGVEPATLRPFGATLLFLGLLALPLWTGAGPVDAAVGAFVAALVAGVGAQAPVITGAVLLSGLSVVGTPLLLVAVGSGGAAAAISHAIRRRESVVALGVALVLAAGVPTSLPAAAAAMLGVSTLALRGGETA